ncbi:MAG: CPXCG motif-containing cysteine-rich protein [Phycisphaerales bacterium]|nr:CPXCG motif-containing cysteine-rich protein [Phycisphaerales bacterium]
MIADEGEYTCAVCGEQIVIPLDPSAGNNQTYTEDCPVCCHANVIHVAFDDDGGAQVWNSAE